MKSTFALPVAGAALAALASIAVPAAAAETHVMTVALPDGGLERITYNGSAPPRVAIEPAYGWAAVPAAWVDPFVMFDRISAEMDREMAGMLRAAQALARMPLGDPVLSEAAIGNLPPGAERYAFVSTVSGNGVCGRSITITSDGRGEKPQVVTKDFGNCGAADSPLQTNRQSRKPGHASGLVEIKADPQVRPDGAGIQTISWR